MARPIGYINSYVPYTSSASLEVVGKVSISEGEKDCKIMHTCTREISVI
jgi:hypothetical protein